MVLHLLNILIVDIFSYQQVKIYSSFCLFSSTPLELDHNLRFSLLMKIHAALLYFKECRHGHSILVHRSLCSSAHGIAEGIPGLEIVGI